MRYPTFRRFLLYAFWYALAWACLMQPAQAEESPFIRPAELEPDVAFWRRVYTEVTTQGGLVHDPVNLEVVYEVLELPSKLSPRARRQTIDEAKKKYRRILERLASGASDLTAEERRVRALWPEGTRRARFEQAAKQVRFQLGQADRFREGLVRSGAWMDHIERIFIGMGLPRELAVLPHVESSFNTHAYSKVGAAGMWQFMPSTGRRFMRIDSTVDERLDPYVATDAAARFLQQNYLVLGSWPLAVTAYNHGPAGMRRAKETLGTSDITTILRKYKSRTFGFASRNFYPAFLAALEIDRNPEPFFGPIERARPDDSRVVVMPAYIPAARIAEALELDRDLLQRLNPALLPPVWNGSRYVPRGFHFRVPGHVDMTAALARISTIEQYDAQVAELRHRVRSGETLSGIAAHHGVSMRRLAELNGLRPPYRIRVGQVLELPVRPGAAPAAPAALARAETQTPPAAPSTGVVGTRDRYVVRRGDTLSRIAARHGITEAALMELNSIRDRHFIYEGQVLALTSAARAEPPVEATVPVDSAATLAATTAAAEAEFAEPQSQGEADAIGPTLVPGVHTAASADPTDYSVHEGSFILVQAAETLGHYADWLNVPASALRRLNRMSAATPVVIGRKLKLDFSRVSPEQFELKRQAYHRSLQEAFFAQYRIRGNDKHVIRSGESVWVLAQQRYNIPIWLLRQYNPDLNIGSLRPGTELIIPLVEPVSS